MRKARLAVALAFPGNGERDWGVRERAFPDKPHSRVLRKVPVPGAGRRAQAI
ncbi:MAG: hypothetical protein KME26_00190 [Oscillatoria princeps RMCB-10]|nr:hypothetical protein [Oscillatoria princeps RMCB-10]